jgi:predicted RND superfamily exporter protein
MNRLIRMRNILLVAGVLVTAAAFPVAGRLSFDQSLESFFAPDNPDILLLKRSRADFGGDEFAIVAWKQPDLITREGDREVPELTDAATTKITQLADQLNAVPGVNASRTRHLVRYLDKAPRSRNTRGAMLKMFEGTLIGADGETTAIILQLLPESESSVPRAETIREIRRIAGEVSSAVAVAGEPVQIFDMFDLVERDGRRLYLISVVVLSGMLLLIFGGVRWVAASIGIVVASVVCTRAALVLSGVKLSMVSSMLDSLVTVTSVAVTMPLIVRYRDDRRLHESAPAAVMTIRHLWEPTFWAIVTNAVGFGALLCSDIIPVRSFAIMMMMGTGMVLLFTVLVTPAMLASGTRVAMPRNTTAERILERLMDRLAHTIEFHPRKAALVCVIMTLVSAPGLLMLTVETDFSRNFRKSSPIVQSLKFVESHLGGAGTWEVAFDVPQELTSDFLDQTRKLTDQLKELEQEGVQFEVMSLNDAIDLPPRLGDSKARLERLMRRQADLVETLYNPEAHRMRIVLRSEEQQPASVKLAQIERVRRIVTEHFGAAAPADSGPADTASGSPLTAGGTASGLYVLLAHLIDSLLGDQLVSFLISTLGMFVCNALAFRSLKLGLISLLPNIFPVVLVTGTLGLLQIPINIGTAMIASVSMGLTVDSSIHYIMAFERARKTHSTVDALRMAYSGAGSAMVLACLALMVGFTVLTVSAFIPLVYFGALLSLSMLSGMLGTLVMLPLLLQWTTSSAPVKLSTSEETV